MNNKRVAIGQRPQANGRGDEQGDPRADPQAEAWIRQGDEAPSDQARHRHTHKAGPTQDRQDSATRCKAELYTARLTVDITPQLRSRIKLAAIAQGVTVTELLRALLEQEYAQGPT